MPTTSALFCRPNHLT